jgi:hypothetical protein
VNSADVDVWRRTIEGIYAQLRDRPDIDKPLLDELLAILADYRRSHPE